MDGTHVQNSEPNRVPNNSGVQFKRALASSSARALYCAMLIGTYVHNRVCIRRYSANEYQRQTHIQPLTSIAIQSVLFVRCATDGLYGRANCLLAAATAAAAKCGIGVRMVGAGGAIVVRRVPIITYMMI